MDNNDDLLKNYIESQKRQKEILEETKIRRLKNENFADPLEENSKNLIESNKEISIPDHENQNHADKSTSLSQEIKNKGYHAFWEEERKRNNYAKSLERFETLDSQSGLNDWEEFLDHYLIDLHNKRANLTNKEFTDKVLEFYLVFGCEEIESFIDGISHDQIHKYRERYNLSTKESLLIDDFVEKLPCERYTYVLNYFNEVVKDKYSDLIINKNNWSDDYDLSTTLSYHLNPKEFYHNNHIHLVLVEQFSLFDFLFYFVFVYIPYT